jgi:hypothetical protein
VNPLLTITIDEEQAKLVLEGLHWLGRETSTDQSPMDEIVKQITERFPDIEVNKA